MSELVLRYGVMVVLAVLATVLVLTGHDNSNIAQVIGAAFSFIVGILFRDTISVQNKMRNDSSNGAGQ